MKAKVIKALAKKDINLFFKNKFFAMITVLGLLVYIVFYFIMPKTANEKLGIGIYSNIDLTRAVELVKRTDTEVILTKSGEDLENIVAKKEVMAGFVIPSDIVDRAKKGETISIELYTPYDIEPELKDAMEYIGKELIYAEFGYGLNIESKNIILGKDLVGKQIPIRDRMVPVFIFLLIITETLGLASVIADEVERKTIYSILVTPATIPDIFVSKGIMGLVTTFIPAFLFVLVTVGFKNFGNLLLLLLFGSIFVISIGFFIGSISKDMMSAIAWGVLFFIILFVPSMNVIAPGSLTEWVRIIPSSFLVDSLHGVINFGDSFKEIYKFLLALFGSAAIFFGVSTVILRRRFQ